MDVRRKEFLALFQTRTATDPYTGKERKEAVYIGPVYRLRMETSARKRASAWLVASWLVAAAAYVLSGLTNAASSRCFYVFPFYAAALFPLFYWGLGVLRVCRLSEHMTEVDRDAGPERLHRSALGCAVLAALHTAANIVFLALGGAGQSAAAEAIALAGVALMGLGALGALRLLKSLEDACEKQEA